MSRRKLAVKHKRLKKALGVCWRVVVTGWWGIRSHRDARVACGVASGLR
jgi:hypothetical protein